MRWLATAAALASLAAAIILALHYPIAPAAMVVIVALWSLLAAYWPQAWLCALPALVPLIGFASWTGWLTFEEVDLMVLGAAAGGYARFAFEPAVPNSGVTRESQHAALAYLAFALLGLSWAIALYRGGGAAADVGFDWFGGYLNSGNAWRIGKSFALALLLFPLLKIQLRQADKRSIALVAKGMAAGLAVASGAVVWERMAFTDLTNFSSDYRATGLFWEMHVGGAALDGYLALAAPFAVWVLMGARTGARMAVAAVLCAIAYYASLVTFSRGLYLAAPVGLALLVILLGRQRHGSNPSITRRSLMRWSALALVIALGAYMVFRHGGYRSLAAVGGVFVMLLALGPVMWRISAPKLALAVVMGFLFATVALLAGRIFPQGSYLVYAVAFVITAVFIPTRAGAPLVRTQAAAAAAFFALVVAAGSVALHWGGQPAFLDSAAVLAAVVVVAVWNALTTRPLFPDGRRTRLAAASLGMVVTGVVVVVTGGAYMPDRFATTTADLQARIRHWDNGIGMLVTPVDWTLGKGFGRYPQEYLFLAREPFIPGVFSLARDTGNTIGILSGPSQPGSFGEMLRLAQRVPPSPGIYQFSADVGLDRDATLHVEICEQHLLYNGTCAIATKPVRADSPRWQRVELRMDGSNLSAGHWYAPRLAFFSIAVASERQRVEIDNIRVVGPNGEVVANGDFSEGMARWFIISERLHLPWHAKNVFLNVLIEQGMLGLCAWLLVVGIGLWRVTVGRSRNHPLAPYLAASMTGFLVVGISDSLLDVPRVALVFYLMVLLATALPLERSRLPRGEAFESREVL